MVEIVCTSRHEESDLGCHETNHEGISCGDLEENLEIGNYFCFHLLYFLLFLNPYDYEVNHLELRSMKYILISFYFIVAVGPI